MTENIKNDTVFTIELFLIKNVHFSDFTGYQMLVDLQEKANLILR